MYAIVFGRAKGVWDEMAEFRRKFAPCGHEVVIAVGRAGTEYPGAVDHWVSFHAELFETWTIRRRRLNYPRVDSFWTALAAGRSRAAECEGYKIQHVTCDGGSSGLIGVRVGQAVHCKKIILCGIPMNPEAEHTDQAGLWNEALVHRTKWEKVAPELKPFVRSMSGWTRDLFGPPTKEWLLETVPQT